MKPRNRQCRSLDIPNSRWLAYATASAATFVVGSQAAEGAIHYSGRVDVKLSGKPNKIVTFQLDRPGDSIAFQHVYHFTYFAGFKVAGIQSREFVGSEGIDYHSVYRLHRNEYVSQGHLTSPAISEFVSLAPGGGFFNGGIGFIGFKFNGGAGSQYGWARVRMNGPDRGYSFTILDYAYADPGEAIRTGQTSSDLAGLDQGSLGLLALGAAGLAAWRKSRFGGGSSVAP
jgi:hypothetical protein